MKLRDVSTPELRRMIRTTEDFAGPASVSVRVLRRELESRELERRELKADRSSKVPR